MDEEDCYVLALDGDQRPCRVITSNAGHCLFTGITKESKAPRLISRCLREDMFCGWGIRTVSALARRYNPMSYHNGSVWPHDNALMALGFARWGASDRASQVLSALLDAATTTDDRRLPELFCGFSRTRHHGPVPYPVACKPQAWSAGSVFLLLQAALGAQGRRLERHYHLRPDGIAAGHRPARDPWSADTRCSRRSGHHPRPRGCSAPERGHTGRRRRDHRTPITVGLALFRDLDLFDRGGGLRDLLSPAAHRADPSPPTRAGSRAPPPPGSNGKRFPIGTADRPRVHYPPDYGKPGG